MSTVSEKEMSIVPEACKALGDIVERAEALLAGITQGYWKNMSDHPDHFLGAVDCGEKRIALCNTFQSTDPQYRVTHEKTRANATFIAASPELVRGLCEEVKRLREMLDATKEVNGQFHETIIRLGEMLVEAKARAAEAERHLSKF